MGITSIFTSGNAGVFPIRGQAQAQAPAYSTLALRVRRFLHLTLKYFVYTACIINIFNIQKDNIMYGCQQQLINADSDTEAVLEFICSEANKLTNCAIYYCRQMFFKAHKYVSNYELDEIMKSNLHFKALRSAVAQQACRPKNSTKNL